MNTNTQQIVDSVVVKSTQELFEAYEVTVSKQPVGTPLPVEDIAYAGVIGFTGNSMRGTLVLAPTRKLLERSHQGSPCEFRDWAGELANQLLGRIKNQLRAYGADIHVTTPVVIKGSYLASVPRGELTLHCFAASPGNVSVWFDAEVGEGADLQVCVAEPGPTEGDSIIF